MTPPVNHHAEAVALIRACDALRDNFADHIPWHEIQAAATLAQVHATLAVLAGPPPVQDDPYWAQAKRLEDLLVAVRNADLHQRGPAREDVITIRRDEWKKIQRLVRGKDEA